MDVAGAQARTFLLLLRHPAFSLRGSASVSFSCGGARRSWAASATAEGEDARGYERVPMDTPGAYRLVDRSTGRSVIVWGGVDDGDEPSVPSPVVLSRSTRGTDRSTSKGAGNGGRAGVGSFGRLKAQKVQALARRSSAHLKREGTSSRKSITRRDESSFASSDEEGSNFGRKSLFQTQRAVQNRIITLGMKGPGAPVL